MRWDDLFADLEGQLSAELSADFEAEVADRTRAERAAIDLAARLVASRGATVRVTLAGGEVVADVVADVAAQWLLLRGAGPQTLVPVAAIASVQGLAPRAAVVTEVERRLSLGYALRALSRDRARVVVHTSAGVVAGVVGSVGADHVDVASTEGVQTTVPFAAIRWIRSA